MKYTLVMFTSRNDTLHFYNIIKQHNGFCSIINTPHTLSHSCGISVKISNNLLNLSKQIISNNKFYTFKGIYEISQSSPNNIPSRIF